MHLIEMTPSKSMSGLRGLAMVGMFSVLSAANAAFITPTFRGEPETTYQAWDIFSSLAGPNAPDVALSNPNGTPNVKELAQVGFITGGNIYTFFAPIGDFEVTVPNYGFGAGYETKVVVQILTRGRVLDLTTVKWNGIAYDDATLLDEAPFPGFEGSKTQEWKFEWTVPGNLSLDTLTFRPSDEHFSLDQIAIDTQAVAIPEVESLLMTLGAASAVGAVAYRRRIAQVG